MDYEDRKNVEYNYFYIFGRLLHLFRQLLRNKMMIGALNSMKLLRSNRLRQRKRRKKKFNLNKRN